MQRHPKPRAMLAALAASVLLAACGGAEPPPPSSAGVTERIDLPGEYRIAGVDGVDIDLPHGISAIVSASRIDVHSGCIRFAWSYSYDGQVLTTTSEPVASCRRALLPEEQALSAAIDAATAVARTPANGIELSGAGRSVILFSQ